MYSVFFALKAAEAKDTFAFHLLYWGIAFLTITGFVIVDLLQGDQLLRSQTRIGKISIWVSYYATAYAAGILMVFLFSWALVGNDIWSGWNFVVVLLLAYFLGIACLIGLISGLIARPSSTHANWFIFANLPAALTWLVLIVWSAIDYLAA